MSLSVYPSKSHTCDQNTLSQFPKYGIIENKAEFV